MSSPLVSVLLPVFNAERYVGDAVRSILAQTYANLELLVIDDGSTDGSAAVVERIGDPRLRVIRLDSNRGLPIALNEGLTQARGELIARQDADDLSHPRRIETQVAVFADRSDVALAGTRGLVIDERDRRIGRVDRCLDAISIRWYALFDNPFIHTSVMFRRRVVPDEVGGYDTAFASSSQDYELWSRVMRRHETLNLADRLISYRVRPASVTGRIESARGSTASQRFAGVMRTIVERNLRATFDGDPEAAIDPALVSRYVLGVDPSALSGFLAAFERLLAAYVRKYPLAWESADFRRTVARQYDAIAFRVSPPSRRSAWRVYAGALARHPFLAPVFPWPRAIATVVVGQQRRSLFKGPALSSRERSVRT